MINPSRSRTPGALLPIVALVLTLFAGSAAADDTPSASGPLGLVKSSVDRVLGVVRSWPAGSEERRSGIMRVSHELFDFNEIARRALGRHWNGLSAGEQHEFVRLFTEVLHRAFIASVDGYTNERVTFAGEAVDGAWAHVRSQIVPKTGAPVSVDYRLHARHSRWIVYDVVSDHVSLVASYRSQFNSVLRSSSFAQLLERMRMDGLQHRKASLHTPSK